LDIGDPAPALQVDKWVKGQPVDLAAVKGKSVVVVEFWATWCSPCLAAVPHLTELQRKFGPAGVTIIGLTTEDPDNTLEKVEAFVQKQGDKLAYTIGYEKEDRTSKAYMDAAGEGGIPTAFVIDKEGRIAWIGHPAGDLEETLTQLLAGKYDVQRAKQLRRAERDLQTALFSAKWEDVMKHADTLLALNPELTEPWHFKIDACLEGLNQPEQALGIAREALSRFTDKPKALAGLADQLLGVENHPEFVKLAAQAAKRATDLAPNDIDARLAHFGALSASGQQDEARAWVLATLEICKTDAPALTQMADVLGSEMHRTRYGDVALEALDRAITAEPQEPRRLWAKVRLLADMGKTEPAKAAAAELLKKAAEDAGLLNEAAWTLLTEPPFQGKFNELALSAAQRCHEVSGGKNWMFLDTLALAKFETGAVEEAIALEKQALELCPNDRVKPSLQETIERFQAAKH